MIGRNTRCYGYVKTVVFNGDKCSCTYDHFPDVEGGTEEPDDAHEEDTAPRQINVSVRMTRIIVSVVNHRQYRVDFYRFAPHEDIAAQLTERSRELIVTDDVIARYQQRRRQHCDANEHVGDGD